MVYEPQEDSALLAKHVARLSYGRVLDMGTGSGVQAKTAAGQSKVLSVVAVDSDPEAIGFAKKHNADHKITYRQSNLFSKVKGRFDTIIFNPPYLPAEQGLSDSALVGGRRGYEIFCLFLPQAMDFLKPDGQILAVYSSLTRPGIINQCAEGLLLEVHGLERTHLFFEDLIVMRFTKSKARKQIDKDGFRNLSFFAKGKRGFILKGMYCGKKIAVKVKNSSSMAVHSIHHEATMLKRLNTYRIGPKLVRASTLYVAYEFVEGTFILDFMAKATKHRIKKVVCKALEQCRIMDKLGITKQEMTRPVKHILVTKGDKPVMIDFERARVTAKPHNITQFCQFLNVGYVRFVLASKKIYLEPEAIVGLAKQYRRRPTKDSFDRLKQEICKNHGHTVST